MLKRHIAYFFMKFGSELYIERRRGQLDGEGIKDRGKWVGTGQGEESFVFRE